MNFSELKNIIDGELTVDDAVLTRYSRDASIFEVKPELVIHPKDATDVKKIISWVSVQKPNHPDLSITARSAGTDMSGGPLNNSIILDFTKYFNRILDLEVDLEGAPFHDGRVPLPGLAGYALTEPGVYYRDFEKETLKKNLLMPAYPASREICTIGGMVANNSGGEKSLSYGKTDRYVQELNAALSDGNEYVFKALNKDEVEQKKAQQDFEGQIYRQMDELIQSNREIIAKAKPDVSKNSAGYALWDVFDGNTFDLTKLFVGSQGTLGLITKIKLKLINPKKYSKLLVIFLNDLAPLGDLVNTVMTFKPESFESYDDKTLRLALKFFPRLKGYLFKFLPEFWMLLTGGMPKLVLLAEFTGDSEIEVDQKVKDAQQAVATRFGVKTHITHSTAEAQKYWAVRRESFNLLRKHVGREHTAPFIDDVIVHVEQLSEFLPKLNELIGQYKGLTYTIAGHAGDANFHIIPLMDFRREENRKAISELSDKVYDLVISLRGSITAEHNDGLIRTPYLEKMYGREVVELFKKTKEIFDPLNIFNPGKKVGANPEYINSHIVKE